MIVYSHATSGPIAADEEEVRHQLFHAHRYRNKLTELDHAWYRAREAARLEFCPGLEEAQEELRAAAAALKEIEDQIKEARVKARKRGPAPAELAAAKADAAARKVAASEALSALSATLKDNQAYKERLRAIDDDSYAQKKAARAATRAEAEVFPFILNDRSDDADRAMAAFFKAKKEYFVQLDAFKRGTTKVMPSAPELPRFKRFNGTGRIIVQESAGEANRGHLQVIEVTPANWQELRGRGAGPIAPTPGSRRSQRKKVIVRLRVGTPGGRHEEVRWINAPTLLHRDLPAGARIKGAWMCREKVGTHFSHTVQFRVDAPARPLPPAPGDTTAAVNFGWRRLPDGGVRVAFLVTPTGHTEEVRLPDGVTSQIRKADDLKSILDSKFNEIKEIFGAWLKKAKKPAWMAEWWEKRKAGPLAMWKGRERLAGLVRLWRDQRFKGDESIFAALEEWRKKDKHLTDWEAGARRRAACIRLEFYRQLSARWAQTYATFVMATFSLPPLLRNSTVSAPGPEETERAKAEEQAQHWLARAAAVGLLRSTLKAAILRARGILQEPIFPAGHQPGKACFKCEAPTSTPREAMMVRCDHCREAVDRDENVCWNYLKATPRVIPPPAERAPRQRKKKRPADGGPASDEAALGAPSGG
jgi:hypothetical protein